ncbi:MAG: triose-phosphate isomerase [Victivallales bacterium]|nr:triose-phosphate isomerase [Victivallales bacterium]
MARRKLIAGNWKMNMTASEGAKLIADLKAACDGSCKCECAPEVLVCPPFTTIAAVLEAVKGTPVEVGAQNVHWAENGAFTGEISAKMLVELGVSHVIIGHSERRQYFGETDQTVNQRVKAALAAGLKVVLCIGETLDEREMNVTNAIIEKQVRWDLAGVTAEQLANVVLAYEPVWAIGTGKTATNEQAQEVHAFIRALLAKMYCADCAEQVRILYGGSMKPANAAGLLSQPDIDGGLIGGAALKATDFMALIQAAK